MATSPIYNWPEPDNTDLVKNGALAIRTLGNAIDTTMGTMTPKSTYTAKGSIAAATAASTPANLSVGNNGEGLVVDSSTATGLRWQVPKMVNAIINGNFDIWARGTTFSNISTATFTADRFKSATAGTSVNCNVTQQTDVPNASSEYSLEVKQLTSNATSVTDYNIRQPIEQFTILPLLGKTLVLSFWYKSNKTGSHGFRAIGSYNTGGTDQTGTFTVSAADTWEFKTISITAVSAVSASSATINDIGLILDIGFRVSGNGFSSISANDYYRISQIQLEVGSVATPFARAGGTIQGELAACQRYYYRTTSALNVNSFLTPTGIMVGTTNWACPFVLPVPMRSNPSSLDYSGMTIYDGVTGYSFSSLTINQAHPATPLIYSAGSTGMTQYRPAYLYSNFSSSAFIGFSAEL